MFRDGWVVLNEVPIHVCTWGCWIEDKIPGDSVLLCIPGNPGITDFYRQFLATLQPLVDMPVWVLSHAGFEAPPNEMDLLSIDSNPELYNLAGQTKQKKEFIAKYIPVSKKIFFLGHSVGGKICVELLKDSEIARRAEQVHLMFPVLEHISESPNGKLMINVIQYIIPFIIFLAWIASFLPRIVRIYILTLFYWLRTDWNCQKEHWLEGVLKLITTTTANVALFLALDEMKCIKDFDNEVYEKYHSKIYCYYGQNDRWAPLSQYYHLMEIHPKLKGVILDKKFTHSFVLTAPIDMAQLLSKTIRPQAIL